jgi:hypothetical protein
MVAIRSILSSRTLLWALLAVPAVPMIVRAFDSDLYFEELSIRAGSAPPG